MIAGLLAILSAAEEGAAESKQLAVSGQPRTYLVERPAAKGPHPAIVMLHGLNGTAERVAQRTGLAQKGPQEGFAVAFPQARAAAWNRFSPGKETPQAIELFRSVGGPPRDLEFLTMLVAELIRSGIADPRRVYLAGESNGGFMALAMICAKPEMFAGAGLLVTSMPEDLGSECGALKPVPVLILSGTADTVVPYAGGTVAGSTINVWSTDRLLTFFRQRNGCAGAPGQSLVPGLQQRIEVEYSGPCRHAPVLLYRVVGGTHGSSPVALHAGQLMVDFFREKGRASGATALPRELAKSLSHVTYRRFDGSVLVTGEVRRTGTNEWLETNSRGNRWGFRTTTESGSELVLHDASRDVYVRLDLQARKMFFRRGATEDWRLLADITGVTTN